MKINHFENSQVPYICKTAKVTLKFSKFQDATTPLRCMIYSLTNDQFTKE